MQAPPPHRRAVDGGDGDLFHFPQRPDEARAQPEPPLPLQHGPRAGGGLFRVLQVYAHAEVPARPGEDHHPGLDVLPEPEGGVLQLPHHLHAERVAALRPVEDHHGHVIPLLDRQVTVAHRVSPPCPGLPG